MNKNISINPEQLTRVLSDYGYNNDQVRAELYALIADGLDAVALAACENTDIDMDRARDALHGFKEIVKAIFEAEPGE